MIEFMVAKDAGYVSTVILIIFIALMLVVETE